MGASQLRVGGAILAGGQGRRMGEGPQKPLRLLGGKPLLNHVLDHVSPQVEICVINAKRGSLLEKMAEPQVSDRREGFAGPLAGLEAVYEWYASQAPAITHILAVAADMPFLPDNLVARLALCSAGSEETVSLAAWKGQIQPLAALWPTSLRPALSRWLDSQDRRSIQAFVATCNARIIDFTHDFPDEDPFMNVNRPEDLVVAEQRLKARQQR